MDIALHHRIQVGMPGSLSFKFIHRGRDNSKRCQQFMSYIGKELQFGMIQFLRLHFFHFAQPKLITQQDAVSRDLEQPENRSGNKQYV